MQAIAVAHRVLVGRWPTAGGHPAIDLRHPELQWSPPGSDSPGVMLLQPTVDLRSLDWAVANGMGLGGTSCALLLVRDQE